MDSLFTNPERDPRPPESDGRYARIAVERGLDSAPEGLTYASPWTDLEVGERVEVPLGRGDRRTGGIVVAVGGTELLAGISARSVKPIAARAGTRLPESLVRLALWMADYYVCPLGMVLGTMMPSAVKRRVGRHVERLVEPVPQPADAPPDQPPRLPEATRAAWDAIRALDPAAFPAEPRALALRLGLPTVGPINRLVARGLLRRIERQSVRSRAEALPHHLTESRADRPALTDEQHAAVEGIAAAIGAFSTHLLYGITGSGKTEVYLRAIERAAEAGLGALVLVPEIALTPQTVGRFLDRFRDTGVGVAVLHSGLAAGERHRQWAMAASGQARVVVGARSAVFAPITGLGLIVVDEEHDPSFKQDQLPRYHGRDAAIKRAQIEGCPVVLGSATPSLESWINAVGLPPAGDRPAARPRARLWRLTKRVGGGSLPEVRIVDMAQERRVATLTGAGRPAALIGPTLAEALRCTLADNAQAILLLNRRGYATHIQCSSARCGWILMCRECDAALVLHRSANLPRGGVVRCHHCLAEALVPPACPVCGRHAARLGAGTQRAEEELRAAGVPESDMLRVDSDSMDSARDYFEALSRFAAGEVRILLGTQMVAKGLDFPGVRLVGVLSADTALHIPDFRSAERTFQLVCQVAGRAGRADDRGLVILQTESPHDPAITLAARHDFESFAHREAATRAAAGLPPASRMARIIARDPAHDAAHDHAARIADALRDAASGLPGALVVGPADCPIARIAGQHRVAVEVLAPSAVALHQILAALRAERLLKSDARTAVDVDPVSLL